MLQFDNVGEYNRNQFLQFGQNNGFEIHFTVQKHEMAKEMNRFLLEKIRCLLSNTQLHKSIWVEALEYANHLMNRLSTAIGGKTPWDILSAGVAQAYDLLRVFGCSTYFSVKNNKLNSRAKKFVYLGVKRNLKGYKL